MNNYDNLQKYDRKWDIHNINTPKRNKKVLLKDVFLCERINTKSFSFLFLYSRTAYREKTLSGFHLITRSKCFTLSICVQNLTTYLYQCV